MPSAYRITATWQGFQGAPGYSKFTFSDLVDVSTRNAAGARVAALFQAFNAYFAIGWSILVSPQIDEFDISTGALLASANMTTPPAAVQGTTAPAVYAGGSGFCITWNTNYVHNRRRTRGRTYFVPAFGCFDSVGTLSTGFLTAANTAANTFIGTSAPRPNIWQRTFTNGTPAVQVGGALATIESVTIKDMASQLRSRRL